MSLKLNKRRTATLSHRLLMFRNIKIGTKAFLLSHSYVFCGMIFILLLFCTHYFVDSDLSDFMKFVRLIILDLYFGLSVDLNNMTIRHSLGFFYPVTVNHQQIDIGIVILCSHLLVGLLLPTIFLFATLYVNIIICIIFIVSAFYSDICFTRYCELMENSVVKEMKRKPASVRKIYVPIRNNQNFSNYLSLWKYSNKHEDFVIDLMKTNEYYVLTFPYGVSQETVMQLYFDIIFKYDRKAAAHISLLHFSGTTEKFGNLYYDKSVDSHFVITPRGNLYLLKSDSGTYILECIGDANYSEPDNYEIPIFDNRIIVSSEI